jgi:multidrug efflux system membrane fusion protein
MILGLAAAAGAAWYYDSQAVAWLKAKGAPPAAIEAVERIAALGRGPAQRPEAQAAAPQGVTPARNPPPPVLVVAGTVERKPMPVVLDTVGSVQSIASIALKPRVDSQVVALPVKEGDAVKAGQLIVQLDARSIDAQIQQASAAVEKDRAQVAQAQRDAARTQSLLATRVASQLQAENAQTALATAQAMLAADQANLNNLKVQRSYYDIYAPVTGRIGSLPYKVGSAVRAADATALATVNQITPVYVAFAVPQTALPLLQHAIRTGSDRVEVSVPDSNEAALEGRIAFIENAVDANSGTLTAKAEVANPAERLWPGQFVKVRLVYRVDPDSLTVAQGAVQLGQSGAYVFVVKPDRTVEQRPVVVDRVVDGRAVVAKGLEAGESIVVDGQLRLTPGARVTVQGEAAPDAKPPASS